jgi:hypothetical protein
MHDRLPFRWNAECHQWAHHARSFPVGQALLAQDQFATHVFMAANLMEQIRPGDYALEIAPDQAKRLKIRLASEHRIKVGHHGKLIRLKIVVAPG